MAITLGFLALVVICVVLASRIRGFRGSGAGHRGLWYGDGGSDCGGGFDGGGGGDGGGC